MQPMQAAVSTACLFPKRTEDAFYDLCLHGIHHIEVFLNAPSEAKPIFGANLRTMAERFGVQIPSVHPWTATSEGFMLFSPYERRCEDFLEDSKRIFALMNQIGANIYILHGAMAGTCRNLELYCTRFQRLAELGRTFGITVTQENVHRYESQSLRFLREFCTLLGDDAKLTFDTKQAIRAGINPLEAVRAVGKHIAHVHLSDHGDLGDCLRIGKGRFPIVGFLSQLRTQGFDGTVTLELYREAFGGTHELTEDFQRIERLIERSTAASQ